eukprot:610_1
MAQEPKQAIKHIADEFKEPKQDILIKTGMLGDPSVGKTTLMIKYVKGDYEDGYLETLGVSFREKIVSLKDVNVAISIWDLGGDKQFASLMPLICNDAKVILFVFDLTQKASLHSIRNWYKEAKLENNTFIPLLIGTKYDLFKQQKEEYQQVIIEQSRKYAEKMKAPLVFCSSKESINVKKIFKIIIDKVFDLDLRIGQSKNGALCEYKQKNKKKQKDEHKEKHKKRKKKKSKKKRKSRVEANDKESGEDEKL